MTRGIVLATIAAAFIISAPQAQAAHQPVGSCMPVGSFGRMVARNQSVVLTLRDGTVLAYQRVSPSPCPDARVFYSLPTETSPSGKVCPGFATWIAPFPVSSIGGTKADVFAAARKIEATRPSGAMMGRTLFSGPLASTCSDDPAPSRQAALPAS